MREIEFRGVCITTKRWLYGDIQQYKYSTKIHVHGDKRIPGHEINRNTIGQYTGLKDKNGVKIFEGDILNKDGHLFLVIYDNRWAKFKLQHDKKAVQYPKWNRGILMEVIGNIHNNPELFTEVKNANS